MLGLSKSPDWMRHCSRSTGQHREAGPQGGAHVKYMLMDYVQSAGWEALTKAEQEHWLGAYKAYMQAMTNAGVLQTSGGLKPASMATTVRVVNDKTQVLDGPYAESKEQLGGYHIIEVADLDAAIASAARAATALHRAVASPLIGDGSIQAAHVNHNNKWGSSTPSQQEVHKTTT